MISQDLAKLRLPSSRSTEAAWGRRLANGMAAAARTSVPPMFCSTFPEVPVQEESANS